MPTNDAIIEADAVAFAPKPRPKRGSYFRACFFADPDCMFNLWVGISTTFQYPLNKAPAVVDGSIGAMMQSRHPVTVEGYRKLNGETTIQAVTRRLQSLWVGTRVGVYIDPNTLVRAMNPELNLPSYNHAPRRPWQKISKAEMQRVEEWWTGAPVFNRSTSGAKLGDVTWKVFD